MGAALASVGALQAGEKQPAVGADVAEVFARARAGESLRYVALGGSITQAGRGWIGPWLRRQFPDSQVTAVNAGMAGTGSALGLFRIGRDVISYQPDLVAIEYCVNDGSLNDEDAIRYMESLIVRLKKLPKPPAIIILEAADKNRVNLARHRKVAQHYGLLEVDLQKAVDDELAKGAKWENFFSDLVHPNKDGHALYTRVIEQTLEHVPTAGAAGPAHPLPPPLSAKPLLLDGRMAAFTFRVGDPGWEPAPAPPATNFIFNGVLQAEQAGAILPVTFRGTCAGVLFGMQTSGGAFYASIDGALPEVVAANLRDGYGYVVLANELPAGEHLLNVVLPPPMDPMLKLNGPIGLGYLLLAGEEGYSNKQPEAGRFSAGVLTGLAFSPTNEWMWTGPFVSETEVLDAKALIVASFPPEKANYPDASWRAIPPQAEAWINLQTLAKPERAAIVYAKSVIESPRDGDALLSFKVDYFAEVWVNGKSVLTLDGRHAAVELIPVKLKAGKNDILLKLGSGSAGFGFSLAWGLVPTAAN